MELLDFINLSKTALELGLICSIVAMSLFLSYKMLGICDLSTDACFTLGASVGAVLAINGHPYLAIILSMFAGSLSGLIVSILQTKAGINSLLSGIIVNTALYSINIFIMGGSSLLNMNKTITIFTIVKDYINASYYKIIVALLFVILVSIFLNYFLKTRLGLTIKACGNNIKMLSSIGVNSDKIIIIGLMISGCLTALSGNLLAQSQKFVSIDTGSGILTIALASLLIGSIFDKESSNLFKLLFTILGSIIFRLIYMLALRFNMPAYMLKFVSSLIIVLAISLPYFKNKFVEYRKRKLNA